MSKSSRSRRLVRKIVPYVRGFRPPTVKQRADALGECNTDEYDASPKFFRTIPKCTSQNDWLAQYKEEGQTYDEFISETPWLSRRKLSNMKQSFLSTGKTLPEKYPDGKIYILPLGNFDSDASPQFDAMMEYAKLFFCLPVVKLPQVELDETKSDVFWTAGNSCRQKIRLSSRLNVQSGRRQLKVQDILQVLRLTRPRDGICLIALTMSDLYETKADLFVAGMASGRNNVAVFSLFRYDPNIAFCQEFWYKIKQNKKHDKEERAQLILLRSCRLLVHEASHLLGLAHCIYYACCMNGSGHLQEDFTQPMHLCPVDLHKLQSLCGFDVCDRYRGLQKFFEKHSMISESQWIIERLCCIQK